MLPNFLIVGVQKGGTASLRSYLAQHPDVFVAPRELRFFSDDENFRRGLGWYESQFAGWSGQKAVGEKSPAYCLSPAAAERIAKTLPGVRLIWTFRDPVDRAYSQYWHSVSKGKEGKRFERALELERRGGRKGYLERGQYHEQIERFLQYVPRELMLFLLAEDLSRDPHAVLERVCEFLGVDVGHLFTVDRRANVTHMPRSVALQRLGHEVLSRLGRGELLFRRLNTRSRPGYPPMDPSTREDLDRYYAGHNERLAKIARLDLSAWSKSASRSGSVAVSPEDPT
jgi:hypothetical protein